jgi:CRISPR-associated endoribonuclease Cas6
MPSRWLIHLDGAPTPRIPVNAPHAVVSGWLDGDHKAPVKGYSLTPPRTTGRRTVLEVRLLDDALTERLESQAEPGRRVRLGHQHFTVAAPPARQAATPWPNLATATTVRAWEVHFLSPATFRRGSRTSPLPAPESILTSLASRWQALHPQTAPFVSPACARTVWVSDIEGRSEALELRDTVVSGFVGRLRYVCDGSDDDARITDALFRFAAYAGVGSHTAFGLGTVAVNPTWQPTRQ